MFSTWKAVGQQAVIAVSVAAIAAAVLAQDAQPAEKLVGMYVHQHWPYKHPYAARTWTLEDWRGYVEGLKRLGYNTILIWPVLETMPEPLLPSDRANLEKIRRVIDIAHDELDMRVYVVLCPNVAAVSKRAGLAAFEQRHFFHTDMRVDPSDGAAVEAMIQWREQLLTPLAKVDGVAIIDSDPGGYPGSSNREFVDLLLAHREMLDRLRPGIELIYWMHVGWEAYSRWYAAGEFTFGTEASFVETLRMLAAARPEPWGVAGGDRHPHESAGVSERMIAFNYGRIEREPSFPMTNFGGDRAYQGGRAVLARGVMGNAQTHCVQLPNTFAFARGALGQPPPTDADYAAFAERLIVGQGQAILSAWKALAGEDSAAMRQRATNLEAVAAVPLQTGDLPGLLFGNPKRFLRDLIMQLRMKAAYHELALAVTGGIGVTPRLAMFLEAAERWQRQHGYQNLWSMPGMNEVLRALGSARVNHILDYIDVGGDWFARNPGATAFERIQTGYANVETYTPQLIEALRQTLAARQRENR